MVIWIQYGNTTTFFLIAEEEFIKQSHNRPPKQYEPKITAVHTGALSSFPPIVLSTSGLLTHRYQCSQRAEDLQNYTSRLNSAATYLR
jgi:hypothetical protein